MRKLALNINTYQLVYYDYVQDGRLYKCTIDWPDRMIGHKDKYVLGLVNINKLLKP